MINKQNKSKDNMSTPKSHNPGVAVIGSGYWGKNLIRNFYELGALKLICDKSETLLNGFREKYADLSTCFALNEVLSRNDIQGVVISTPAETHYTIAREVLLAGKHVFVEKPFVLDEEEAKDLTALAEANNLVLMVGHVLQYHPVFVRLKGLADAGDLGRINYVYSHRLNLGKIRREENILWSFAPHDISMILSLAGEEPDSVATHGGYYLHQKIADVTTTHLEFPSGLRAHIFVSWLHPNKEQKLVVVGDRKMAVFDDTQPWEDKLLLYPHKIKWEHNVPLPTKAEAERSDIPEDEPLRRECQHFLDCITNGQAPLTDGNEGLGVLRILNSSQQSLDEQGLKVYLKDFKEGHGAQTSITPKIAPVSTTISDSRKPLNYFAHKTALVDDGVSIGSGTKIWHFSHVLSGSKIGNDCNIGQNVVVGPDVSVGAGCKIQNNVSVYKGVTLEDAVFCGPSMVFTNVYNPRAEIRKMDQTRPTLVKKGATIGANATIVCGITIGKYAFIGAGAVVNKDVPDHALVVGNPSHQIGWACLCGEHLPEELECRSCNRNYTIEEDMLKEV
jgi:UDP-2-acetamido-3-amino-2,3-dideoxy-glucuronate N-acetyltransferase